LWEERRLSSQDKEPKLRLSLETRVTDDLTVICCKGRVAYGIEAAALSGEIAELAPQTRRVMILVIAGWAVYLGLNSVQP
jgi:hypothetical protein